MNKKVIAIFKELGFKVEKFNENVYGLTYDTIKLIYRYYPEDENFLDVGMPFDISNMNNISVYELANNLNVRLKFVKVYVYKNNLWAACERNLSLADDLKSTLEDVVYCMIMVTCCVTYTLIDKRTIGLRKGHEQKGNSNIQRTWL